MENNTFEIYYDEEGDFLELSFAEAPEEGTTEEVQKGVFITKDVATEKITDVGILDFKKRVEILKEILKLYNLELPLKLDISGD